MAIMAATKKRLPEIRLFACITIAYVWPLSLRTQQETEISNNKCGIKCIGSGIDR